MHTSRNKIVEEIEQQGLVAILRAGESVNLADVCKALGDAGMTACEITMTTPGALQAIEQAVKEVGDTSLIGVGTVLDAETARLAILAGAQFVVSPTLNMDVIAMAHRYDCAIIPAGLTPTEILSAWEAGADVVKVFPIETLGPRYLANIRGPMPQIKLMPTGGIQLDNVAEWINAGACALGAGTSLLKKDLIRNKDWAGLTKLAKQFVDAVSAARSEAS